MKIREIQENGKWFRVDYRLAGKRHRPKFRTLEEAQKFAKEKRREIEGLGAEFASIPSRHRAEMFFAWEMANEGGYSLIEACQHYERSALALSDKPLSLATSEFLASKAEQGLRPRSLKKLESSLRRFGLSCDGMRCSEVGVKHIEAWLFSLDAKAQTVNGCLSDLSGFFNWCARREYIAENPTKKVERGIVTPSEKTILTPSQAREVLSVAKKEVPTLVAFVALGMFAGLRAEAELRRVGWDSILIDRRLIRVAASETKTRRRRLVEMSDNLAEWLRVAKGNKLPVVNIDRKLKRLRRALSFPWPSNCMRHSFCSYHLASHNNAALTARMSGHSESVLFNNYAELVDKETASEWWNIYPQGV